MKDYDPKRYANQELQLDLKASMASLRSHSSKSGKTTSQPCPKNLHKRNTKGETLLHLACQRRDVAQVKFLIKAGLDVNAPDFAGWTALHEAALSGDRAVVEELLRGGARVNARSADGNTPLHDAVSSDSYQVVKLLLEHGSNPQDKNVGGLCALNMAESSDIRELLQMFLQSEPGPLCSEADSSRVPPKASSDNVGQSRTSAQIQDSKDLTRVLSEVEEKQAKLRGCSVKGPEDAGRLQAALRDIHSTLSQVLAKQHMEKDNLAHKYWSVPDYLRKRILKSQLISLASVQQKLVDVLQKQMEVVDELKIPKSQICTNEQRQSSKCPVKAPPRNHVTASDHSSAVDTISLSTPPATNQVKETPISLHQKDRISQKGAAKIITIVSPSKIVPTASITNGTRPVCPQQVPTGQQQEFTHGTIKVSPRQQVPTTSTRQPVTAANITNGTKMMSPRQLVPPANAINGTTPLVPTNSITGVLQNTVPNARSTITVSPRQHVTAVSVLSNQTKTDLSSGKTNQRCLLKLLHTRVMMPRDPLVFLFKGTAHSAMVESWGLVMDHKGRLHLSPEDWIKSIVGNNIPVSAAYAWDKVTYRDRPLSHHWQQMEQTQRGGGEEEELCTSSALDMPTTVPDGLSLVMKIKLVRVIGDDELIPNALMDRFWDRLVKEDTWGF